MTLRANEIQMLAHLIAVGSLACSSPAERHLEAGRRALGQGWYREAITEYAKVVVQAPASPLAAEALYEEGSIQYLKLRDLDTARSTFRGILAEYPESVFATSARRMLARMYEKDLAEPEKAIQQYHLLLLEVRKTKEKRDLLLSISNCRYTLDHLRLAADGYRQVIEDYPYNEQSDLAFLRLANIEYLDDRSEEAIVLLEALLRNTDIHESRRRAFFDQAEILLASQRFQDARSCLERAEREFPSAIEIYDIAERIDRRERESRSLDDDGNESQELLKELQQKIRWGWGARSRGSGS